MLRHHLPSKNSCILAREVSLSSSPVQILTRMPSFDPSRPAPLRSAPRTVRSVRDTHRPRRPEFFECSEGRDAGRGPAVESIEAPAMLHKVRNPAQRPSFQITGQSPDRSLTAHSRTERTSTGFMEVGIAAKPARVDCRAADSPSGSRPDQEIIKPATLELWRSRVDD